MVATRCAAPHGIVCGKLEAVRQQVATHQEFVLHRGASGRGAPVLGGGGSAGGGRAALDREHNHMKQSRPPHAVLRSVEARGYVYRAPRPTLQCQPLSSRNSPPPVRPSADQQTALEPSVGRRFLHSSVGRPDRPVVSARQKCGLGKIRKPGARFSYFPKTVIIMVSSRTAGMDGCRSDGLLAVLFILYQLLTHALARAIARRTQVRAQSGLCS